MQSFAVASFSTLGVAQHLPHPAEVIVSRGEISLVLDGAIEAGFGVNVLLCNRIFFALRHEAPGEVRVTQQFLTVARSRGASVNDRGEFLRNAHRGLVNRGGYLDSQPPTSRSSKPSLWR